MRVRFLFSILLLGWILSLTPASGQITIPELYVRAWCETDAAISVVVGPDGSGDSFDSARIWGGGTVDGKIQMELSDNIGGTVAHYPREDLWLESSLGGLVPCNGGTTADADTDLLGLTFWVQPLRASGLVDPLIGDRLQIAVNGDRHDCPGLAQITLVSPDLNADLLVNLTDVSIFATDYLTAAGGPTPRRSDFHWDGDLNLADLAILARLYGSTCP